MDIMIDIESLSLDEHCAIIQIGAVKFHIEGSGISGKPFLVSIDPEVYALVKSGQYFDVQEKTVTWWAGQSQQAQAGLEKNLVQTLEIALDRLIRWISASSFTFGDDTKSCVWAQGIQYDLVALSHAIRVVGLDKPWEYYQERDSRTYIREATRYAVPHAVTLPKGLTMHRADHDAIRQVYNLQEAYKKNNERLAAISGEPQL